MNNIDHLNRLGLFDTRVSCDTSDPTAPVFTTHVDHMYQMAALAALDSDTPVSLFVHIPFSERLCWFCAYRTQGRPLTRVTAQQYHSHMDTGAIYSKAP